MRRVFNSTAGSRLGHCGKSLVSGGFLESLPISHTQQLSQLWRLNISIQGPLTSMKSYVWLLTDLGRQGARSAVSPHDPGTPGGLSPWKAYRHQRDPAATSEQGAAILNLSVLHGQINRANQLQTYLPSLLSSFTRCPPSHLHPCG